MGQKQTSESDQIMSALPPKADVEKYRWHVRFVPIAVLESRLLQTSTYCALWTVFPNVILGLRKPIAIQAAISFNINLPE